MAQAIDGKKVAAVDMNARVELDVGGRRFSTTLGTMCSVRGTLFWNTFSPESGFHPRAPDAAPPMFIDRDPTHFTTILNYLRDTKAPPPVPAYKFSSLPIALYREAVFYGCT